VGFGARGWFWKFVGGGLEAVLERCGGVVFEGFRGTEEIRGWLDGGEGDGEGEREENVAGRGGAGLEPRRGRTWR